MTEDVEERARLEAELGRLEAERSRLGFSSGMPDPVSIARRDAYLTELDERIAALRKRLPPPRQTLHSRPPLPLGWRHESADEAGHLVDYDPFGASPTARRE